jgi:uncharacterized protein
LPHRRQPDSRSGLVIETHELARSAGTQKQVSRTAQAPEDLGIGVIGVPQGSPVVLELRLEAVGEGVLVTGTAVVELAGECTRCLKPISDSMEIDIQELYYYPGNEPDDEAARNEGERIDLEPVLRDAVVLDLPFTPLCTDDCLGICPTCGADLNDDPDHGHDDDVDPRWGDLQEWSANQDQQ